MFSVMAAKEDGEPFEVFTGTENECNEKLISLKMDKATGTVVSGLNLRDYDFYIEEGKGMKKMVSYRMDDAVAGRLENVSRTLDISKIEVLESLINFGFDLMNDGLHGADMAHTATRYSNRWKQRIECNLAALQMEPKKD